jgi:hypothetical protein
MDSEKKDDQAAERAEFAAEQAAAAAEKAAQAAEAVAVLEVAEVMQAADDGDRGRVYGDGEQTQAQIASMNSGLAQLEARVFLVESILRRQGYKL